MKRETKMLFRGLALMCMAAGVALALAGPGGCEKAAGPPDKTPETPAAPQLAAADRDIVFGVGASDARDPLEAGKLAAAAAAKNIGNSPVRAVLLSECFEDADRKAKVLEGVCSVFDKSLVFGGATYGSFTQAGVAAGEAAAVLVVAGEDISVTAACRENMGSAGLTLEKDKDKLDGVLTAAGRELGKMLSEAGGKLMVIVADAHSPKNAPLVAGVRAALGADFPVTGGSVNKNAGQTYVYYQGRMLTDAVVGLMLDGRFELGMSGRQAKENDKVVSTAEAGAAEALSALAARNARPAAVLAFNCAGRKGKLRNVADELAAMQKRLGTDLPLFGTYNAGEIGPADLGEKEPGVLSSGVGWHVMFTAIGW